MFTNPTPDTLLEGCLVALQLDILPNLSDEKAQVTAVMMQAVIQQVRQLIPAYLGNMAAEHNDMLRTLGDIGTIVGESPGDAAGRIRDRGTAATQSETFPPVPALQAVIEGHRALAQQLVDTVRDLDELATSGNAAGEAGLLRLRQHLGPSLMGDFMTNVVGAGMAGRG